MQHINALFLDRDGIVNIDHGYVFKKEHIEFIDNIFSVCKEAVNLNYKLFIITNQAGIGRGYYSLKDFYELTSWIESSFADRGIKIEKTFFCPHHPKHGKGVYKKNCSFRKPNPGMLISASDEFNIDLENSVLIGDKVSDIEAGIAAGVGKNFILNSSINDKEIYNMPNCFKLKNLIDLKSYL